jgi:hypothetical protein
VVTCHRLRLEQPGVEDPRPVHALRHIGKVAVGYSPFERLGACLDEIGAIDPTYRSTGEKQQAALVGLSEVIARAQAEQLRILATSGDIAEATGARTTAAWLADQTRDNPGTLRRHAALADALEKRWTKTRHALAAGSVNLAQATVMVAALD